MKQAGVVLVLLAACGGGPDAPVDASSDARVGGPVDAHIDAANDAPARPRIRISTKPELAYTTVLTPVAVKVRDGTGPWRDATLVAPSMYEADVDDDHTVLVVCQLREALWSAQFAMRMAADGPDVPLPCDVLTGVGALFSTVTPERPFGSPDAYMLGVRDLLYADALPTNGQAAIVPQGTIDAVWYDSQRAYRRDVTVGQAPVMVTVDMNAVATARPQVATSIHGATIGETIAIGVLVTAAAHHLPLISHDGSSATATDVTSTIPTFPASLLRAGETVNVQARMENASLIRRATVPAAGVVDITLPTDSSGYTASRQGSAAIGSWTALPGSTQSVSLSIEGGSAVADVFESAIASRAWLDRHSATSISIDTQIDAIPAADRIDLGGNYTQSIRFAWTSADASYEIIRR